jgi:hypothetical protein
VSEASRAEAQSASPNGGTKVGRRFRKGRRKVVPEG